MLKIVAAEVMIYGEDFTQWSETASVQTKIIEKTGRRRNKAGENIFLACVSSD